MPHAYQGRCVSVIVAIIGSSEASRSDMVEALDHAPTSWVLQLHREPPERADVVVCDRDIEGLDGALVFDPRDDLVARIAARVDRPGRTIVVSSPGGGTGATSVAIHLAAELAARGHTTGLVDMDPQRGAHARLGLDTEPTPPEPIPIAGGFRVSSSLDHSRGFRRVVVDVPRAALGSIDAIDAGVLVAVPTPAGARRVEAMIEAHPGIPWHVVLNRLGPGGETTRAQVERMIGRSALELPACAALRDSEDDGRLLRRGWTRWSRGIGRLAAVLDA